MDIISTVSYSKISKEVYKIAYVNNPTVPKEDITVLMGLTWSADFDPNSSIKKNRGRVWIRTGTFVSESFCENKPEDTFTIGIGLNYQNHDEIEQRFQKELQD